jgi:GWxTD domain-containing protein
MRKTLFLSLYLVFNTTEFLSAGGIQAYFDYSVFAKNGKSPFIETYFSIAGNSVKYLNTGNGIYQGKVEVVLVIKQGESIKFADKYTLLSPGTSDSLYGKDFIDQQRIPLAAGDYVLEFTLKDLNSSDTTVSHSEKISVDFPVDKISISDISFSESYSPTINQSVFSKNGFDMVPFPSDFFSENINKLIFYSEVYNSNKTLAEGEIFLVNYFVENADNSQLAGSLRKFVKEPAKEVNVVFAEFPINHLKSGNYNLVVEARDKENKLLAVTKKYFQRSNPNIEDVLTPSNLSTLDVGTTFVSNITNSEEMKDHIQSTFPISTQLEKNFARNQLNFSDQKMMQQYFYNFWKKRNDANPEQAWLNYYEEVKKANKEYGTSIRRGYATDRGRVYLQYGAPNTVTATRNEPSSYPYEIWHYYVIPGTEINRRQSDKRFVFMNADLIGADYELIHSTAYGEVKDDRWQLRLQGRNEQYIDLDQQDGRDHFGNRANELFNTPR